MGDWMFSGESGSFSGEGGLDDIHFLHEEGSVAIEGDALPEPVVEVQLVVFDDAFETIIADLTGYFFFKASQRKVV